MIPAAKNVCKLSDDYENVCDLSDEKKMYVIRIMSEEQLKITTFSNLCHELTIIMYNVFYFYYIFLIMSQ